MGECCKEMKEKLERSEAGRKKLRQAIGMLKEKLEGTEKLMQLNDALKQDLEKERVARKTAEESQMAFGKDGKSLKETLASALLRIERLEASKGNDRKEIQQLREEMKSAIDAVRLSVKTIEAVRGSYHDLKAKVNQMSNNCGRAGQLQNGLQNVQLAVGTLEKELFSLASRATALEKQYLELQQVSKQKQQVQVDQSHQNGQAATFLERPERLPSRTQQQLRARRPGIVDLRHALEERRANVEGTSVSNSARPSSQAKKERVENKRKDATAPSKHMDAAKDGSDITVQEDGAIREPVHLTLLSSLSRLVRKEKRTHEKMETKLAELEKVFGDPVSSAAAPLRKKRKESGQRQRPNKRAKKLDPEVKATRKVMEEFKVSDDSDTESTFMYEQWLETKKNLLTPTLPVVPPPVGATEDCHKDDSKGFSEQQRDNIKELHEGSGKLLVNPSEKDVDAVASLRVSTEDNRGPNDLNFRNNYDILDAHTAASLLISTKNCFLDTDGNLKPAESWKVNYKQSLLSSIPMRTSMPILQYCLIEILGKEHGSNTTAFNLAAFVLNVICGSEFDMLIKHLASFLTVGKVRSVSPALQSSIHEATVETVRAASKLLAAVCKASGNDRLLQRITCRILRWSQMENLLLVTSLASMFSVSKQLLADVGTGNLLTSAMRCFASQLVAEVDSATDDIKLLQHLEVDVDETVQAIVESALHLLVNSSAASEFYLVNEVSMEDMKSDVSSSWHASFRLAMEALELVALQMGWAWTYNELIVGKLWNLVAPGASQATVASFAYLLGRLGSLGSSEDMPGVKELRQRLAVILKAVTSERGSLTFATRVVAARALLELSVTDETPGWGAEDETNSEKMQVLHSESVKSVREWFEGLDAEQQDAVPLPLRKRIFVL